MSGKRGAIVGKWVVALAPPLSLACGSTSEPTGVGGGSTGATTSATATSSSTDTTASDAAGSSSASGEPTCAPPSSLPCPRGEYCAGRVCGHGVPPGVVPVCAQLPTCGPGGRPVCGCDGETYDNDDCALRATGLDRCYDEGHCPWADVITHCTPPAGYFACGDVFCDIATEFCSLEFCALAWQVHECKPLPGGCTGEPSCDCLDFTTIGPCDGSATEGFTVALHGGPDGC